MLAYNSQKVTLPSQSSHLVTSLPTCISRVSMESDLGMCKIRLSGDQTQTGHEVHPFGPYKPDFHVQTNHQNTSSNNWAKVGPGLPPLIPAHGQDECSVQGQAQMHFSSVQLNKLLGTSSIAIEFSESTSCIFFLFLISFYKSSSCMPNALCSLFVNFSVATIILS